MTRSKIPTPADEATKLGEQLGDSIADMMDQVAEWIVASERERAVEIIERHAKDLDPKQLARIKKAILSKKRK